MRAPNSLLALALAAGCAQRLPPAPSPAAAISAVPAPPPPVTVTPPVEPPPSAVASASTVPTAPPAPVETPISHHLDASSIQRILRQNHGRFRLCYEEYLSRTTSPNLQARVSLRFVIGRDGGVRSVTDAGSDLPSSEAIRCMMRAMYGLSFPQPKGAPVTVTYPFVFTPGG